MRTIKIYPESWAAMLADRAGQKYQPSNGSEGEIFTSSWCGECARDLAMSEGMPIEECDDNQKCEILGRSFLSIDDSQYPSEWQYGKDGQPRCTAFVFAGHPIPVKDENTVDMFAEAASKATQSTGAAEGDKA
jgi:hypothetical protein